MENTMKLAKEFMRYLVVGGSAFVVDFGVLYLTKTFLFDSMGNTGILLATAIAFIAGLLFNYVFSILFVFEQAGNKIKGKEAKAFALFALIGVIGLGLTQLGMYLGITIFDPAYYLVVKAIVAIVVLFWNYIARKVLIFN